MRGRPNPKVLPVPVLAWNRLFLNGERFDNSFGFEGLDHVGVDTEVGKIHVLDNPRL
jgi:hypothetical protein